MILGMLLWFNLGLGLQRGAAVIDLDNYAYMPPITAEIELHAENDWLDIYGIYYNGMYHDEGFSFIPAQDSFSVGVKLKLDHFSIEYQHNCLHPVSWRPDEGLAGVYGGHDKIWVEVSSK